MTDKVNKSDVEYGPGMKASHCGPMHAWPTGDCKHFEAPRSCEIVRGRIEPDHWCKRWSRVSRLYSHS